MKILTDWLEHASFSNGNKLFNCLTKINALAPKRVRVGLSYVGANTRKLIYSLRGKFDHGFHTAVSLSDLRRFGQLYEPGTLLHPIYALAGGTAVQCWLQETDNDREHWDIDLFAFTPDLIPSIFGSDIVEGSFPIGRFAQGRVVGKDKGTLLEVNITYESYFDAEIVPTSADLRAVTVRGFPMLALSPEFIAVTKFSYPNVHRQRDFFDVLALNQAGQLQNSEYLTSLLARTSLGKIIDASSILSLEDEDDLQLLLDKVRLQLIRRFLYWNKVSIKELDTLQMFLLVDMDKEFLDLPLEKTRFVNRTLLNTAFQGNVLSVAQWGLYVLVAGLPDNEIQVLADPKFQARVCKGVKIAQYNPDSWLSSLKTILKIFQQLRLAEDIMNHICNWVWNPNTITNIVEKILFEDTSRLVLYTSIESICDRVSTRQITESEYAHLLGEYLTPRKV